MILGSFISVFVPLAFLYIIWNCDIYSLSRLPWLAGAILWGIGTFAVALIVQSALAYAGQPDFWQITLFNAPILEQLLKASLVIWLASRMRLLSAIDGATYGFAVGTGFAIAENLLYVQATPDQALGIALARVLSVSLMHAFTTAIIGTVAGASLAMAQHLRAQRISLALLTSILLHSFFNRLVLTLDGVLLISLAIVIGLSGTALVVWMMRRALVTDAPLANREPASMMPLPANVKALSAQQLVDMVVHSRVEHDAARLKLARQYIALQVERDLVQRGLRDSQRPQFEGYLSQRLTDLDQQLAGLRARMGLYTCVWLHAVLYASHSGMWDQIRGQMMARRPVLALSIELRRYTLRAADHFANA